LISKNNTKARPFVLTSLKDRILQKMVYLAILPIIEYQADSYSFGFRKDRNAHQAISIIADCLVNFSKVNRPIKRSNPTKVSTKVYNK
jgi:retron-type reverse transcriptase